MPAPARLASWLLTRLLVFAGTVAVSTLVTLLALSLMTRTAASATPRLPNLIPLPASQLQIGTVNAQNQACGGVRSEPIGTKLLCFTTTSWNAGTGPLELEPGELVSGRQQVYQRVFNNDSTFVDTAAGFMDYHPTHNHMHFNDYALYTLRAINVPGIDDDVTGVKTTFCVIDTGKINGALPGAPLFAHYVNCTNNPAGPVVAQGMSVGWGDSYTYNLDGQSVVFDGMPDGLYRLIIEIDTLNRIQESNDNDNDSTMCFRVQGTNVSNVTTGAQCGMEICDGLDNDNDNQVDEFFPDTDTDAIADCVDTDDDGDGYSDADEMTLGENPLIWCATMRADSQGTDHTVSIVDLSSVAGQFGKAVPPAPERIDQNADDQIDLIDLSGVAGQFGKNVSTCPNN